jgi:adenylate cyclase
MADLDGVVRHALLYVDVPERGRVESMACAAARLLAQSRGEELVLPRTDERGNFYIPYAARPGDFYDGVSLVELIRGEVPAEYYAGKIVLIGPWAAGLQDAYFTPIDRGEAMYGIEQQANVIQCLLEGHYKQEASALPQALVLLAVCLAALLFFLRHRPGPSGICFAALALGALALSLLLFRIGLVTHPLWIPLGTALLYVLSVIRHYVLAAREKRRIRSTFERYVAPEIVGEILKEGEEALALGGRQCEVAVLFVDIRGFTTMSERLSAPEVVAILNRYLSMTNRCVEAHRGTLDKFVGDATMAFWGAPLPDEEAVYHACQTAMDIIDGAARLSDELQRERGEVLKVGVGVHFGQAVIGNMGSERRMDYTAIGDTVNTAARLEANAPGGKIYISRAVADALGDRGTFTSLGGSVRLKGKAEGFEVLTLDALN